MRILLRFIPHTGGHSGTTLVRNQGLTIFNEAMASDARLVLKTVLNDCKGVFDGLESLMDAGGGIGIVARAITEEFPHLQHTILDLPHVVAGLKDTGNLKYIGGDILQAIPPADAILIKDNLQNWSDEDSVKILKQCKEAIRGREGGKVIIIDMIRGSQEDGKSVESNTTLIPYANDDSGLWPRAKRKRKVKTLL